MKNLEQTDEQTAAALQFLETAVGELPPPASPRTLLDLRPMRRHGLSRHLDGREREAGGHGSAAEITRQISIIDFCLSQVPVGGAALRLTPYG